MRGLILTEIGFASALVGFGSQFKGADERAQLLIENVT